jgi:hypothetical protein
MAIFDATQQLEQQLKHDQPIVLVNTIGPFQKMNYDIPELCARYQCHYIDIADARDYVTNIIHLNEYAKKQNVLIISGASTVSGLSSAVIEHYQSEFSVMTSLRYGISPDGMWLMSWSVRLGLPLNLEKHVKFYLQLSHYFDCFGTADGGMHIEIQGLDHQGHLKNIKWFLIAKDGDEPQIPCIPAILLTKKLIQATYLLRGAYPCVGLISLDEYMQALIKFNIHQIFSLKNV